MAFALKEILPSIRFSLQVVSYAKDEVVISMFNLTLFFTRRVLLYTWAQNGSLKREIAIYLHLQQKGIRITFVTYGDAKDLQYNMLRT